MALTKRSFILVDHCLSGLGGHPVRQAETFFEAGVDNVAWGCADSALLQHPQFRPVFKTNYGDEKNRFAANPGPNASKWQVVAHHFNCLAVILRTNLGYLREISQMESSSSAIWFVPNTQLFTLPGLLLYAAFHRRQRIICYFQNPPSRHFRVCGRMAKLLRLRNVRFASEEAELCARISSLLGHKVHTILPPLLPKNWLEIPLEMPLSSKDPVVMTVLGPPRREKGFHWLPQVAEGLREELSSGKLRLQVQAGDKEIEMENLQAELTALRSLPGIELFAGPLEQQAYLEKLRESDMVFTPYSLASYGQRSSGIPLEGLALGKPVLLTNNTLVSNVLKQYRAGIFFEDGDIVEMIGAVRRILADFSRFQLEAVAAAEVFRADNGLQQFLARLDELFSR